MKTVKQSAIKIVLFGIILMTFACADEVNPVPEVSIEMVNRLEPKEIWNKFEDQHKIDIAQVASNDDDVNYIIDIYNVEIWSYPEVNEANEMVVKYPMIGLSSFTEIQSKIVLDLKVKNKLLTQKNCSFEMGNANVIFNENSMEQSDQLILNVSSSQEQFFDLEENIFKLYFTNGSGKFKNNKGFAYAKLEIQKLPFYGCYPNNKNYPDKYEDGTCVPSMNCFANCMDGAGIAKLYLLGFLETK